MGWPCGPLRLNRPPHPEPLLQHSNCRPIVSLRSLLVPAPILAVLILLLLALSAPSPSPVSSPRPQPDTTKPLRPLMVGLAQDMDRIATGLWHEDYDLIRQGAHNIAQHPKIPPRQLATIKQALGPQFQSFVQYDKRVHHTATELVEAAEARDWSAVLDTHERLKRGCVTCHTAYRDTVRAVLHP
jgi:cytochrome c556